MGLKSMLNGNWFVRVVLITWIICAVSIFVLFKNMELIVHGQLYDYNLQFSPNWADPYRVYTWLIYISLGLPTALSGIALASSFLKVEKAPEAPKRKDIFQQRLAQPRKVVKLESTQIAKEPPRRVENINGTSSDGGISCPNCEKVFSRPLVMPDFHGDTKQLVSVCPYCYHTLRARQLSEVYNE